MKHIKIIWFLVFGLFISDYCKAQLLASAEIRTITPKEKTEVNSDISSFAGCPAANLMGTLSIVPNKPVFCPGDNPQVVFTKNPSGAYVISGNLSWTYGGAATSTAMAGPNNTALKITGIQSGGPATVSGVMIVSGQNCPFSLNKDVPFTNLVANAGADKTFVPCEGAIRIGTTPCRLNGVPPYNPPPTWTPLTGMVGSNVGCQVYVDNLTSNQTYVLTVSDNYCSVTDQMNVSLACPNPANIGYISISPNQPVYCPGSNISGSFNISNSCFSFNGNTSWTSTGDEGPSGSGSNNEDYTISGITTGGIITATGSVILNGGSLTCPYITTLPFNLSDLAADAGADQVYVPGLGPISIGASVCEINGVPPYSPAPLWSPPTGIVGSPNGCIVMVDNLTATTLYTITVTDMYCTATDVMTVTLDCPDPLTLGNISISPNQPVYCPGSNISGSFNISNTNFSYTGMTSWTSTGDEAPSGSGSNNENYVVTGISTGGVLTATGSLIVTGGALTCPYTSTLSFNLSDLTADAGADKVYVPVGSAISIGTSPCELNGVPPYTPAPFWLPVTGIVGSSNGCVVNVNNLTGTMVYTITVSDTYCTASDAMTVTLACPSPTTLGSISVVPNQPVHCPGSNVSGNFSIVNSAFVFSGNVGWTNSGSNSISGSGANNSNYSITGLLSSGLVQATGNMIINGGTLVCAYSSDKQITQSSLAANAGITQVYVPGAGPVSLGSNPCALNGFPNYTYSWAPTTFFTSASNICQPTVNNVTTSTTYTLTINDQYCTALGTVNVILGAEPYAVLRKVFDGGYYKITGGMLYFKYDAEYNNGNILYKIYNEQNTVLYSNTNLALVKNYGDNRYSFNLTSASITSAGYYYLEVTNEKNEVFKLKFKI